MALSSGSAIKGATTSRLLNKLAYDVANKASDVTTATTSDRVPIVDASADYEVKYADGDNLREMMGVTATAAEINAVDGIATTVTIAIAASATTDGMDITITAKDAAGATVAAVHQLEFWMSENSGGAGLTGDTYSGDLTASVGAILSAHTAKKHWSIATAATGIFTATLVDSANPADQYVVAKKPLGAGVVVSAVSGTNWEGA